MAERAFSDYPDFFSPLFEVTRRYKIMNPEKMRDTYGKMVYLLQVRVRVGLGLGLGLYVRQGGHLLQVSHK